MKARGRMVMLVSLAWLGAVACHESAPPPQTAATVREVSVARVGRAQPRLTVELPAELRPYQDVLIQARVAGFIRHLDVDRGSQVRAGEPLAELDAPDLLAQRAEAEHRVSSAASLRLEAAAALDRDQATLARLHGAAQEDAGAVAGNDIHVAEQVVAADQAELASRQAAEGAAREALNAQLALEAYLKVVAPFTGIVVRRNLSEGALVGPSAPPLVEMQQLDRLRLVVDVPETEAIGIHLGEALPFTVAAQPERAFTGTVARIAHSERPETRTMPIELDVANSDLTLAPGMFARVRWSFQRAEPSFFVPSAAVMRGTERTFVERITRNNTLEWLDVTSGFDDGGQIEVFGRLQEGDRVVVPADDALHPGMQVHASGGGGTG